MSTAAAPSGARGSLTASEPFCAAERARSLRCSEALFRDRDRMQEECKDAFEEYKVSRRRDRDRPPASDLD